MIAAVRSATIVGARGFPVCVEVHVSKGLPGFAMLGLPDESCREARDRVRAAILSSGFQWPDKKVTVNLAPPSYRKAGSGLDLAIAVALLVAFGELPAEVVGETAFVGELGLDGTVRRVAGLVPIVGVHPELDWVVPAGAESEAAIVAHRAIRPVERLSQVVEALARVAPWPTPDSGRQPPPDDAELHDLADVRGQPHARLALEVAAAGGHHLLFVGPPGAGKTMLARRLPGLLPDLAHDLALEATMVHSAAGVTLPASGLITRPPFRAPHHTSSSGALVGGGSHQLRPGEISLAHGGVLFLDEMGQFQVAVLDALREALEDGHIMVGRVNADRTQMPARFQLVGATNPCPCGGGMPGACECDERTRSRYIGRLSGPLLDRFDLRVAVAPPGVDELFEAASGEPTAVVADRVRLARSLAAERNGALNAQLDERGLIEHARLHPDAEARLRFEVERGRLTARGMHRIWRVSRTLSDLAGQAGEVDERCIATALAMRAGVGRSAVSRAA